MATAVQVQAEAATAGLERSISLCNNLPRSFFLWRGFESLDALLATEAGLETDRNVIKGLVDGEPR